MKNGARYAYLRTSMRPYRAVVVISPRGLACLRLTERCDGELDDIRSQFRLDKSSADRGIGRLHRALDDYLQARRPFGTPIPIDPWWADSLDQKVYRILGRTVEGETMTYGEVARRIGSAEWSRRVGLALSRNRTQIAIPCHRVVRQDRATGGYNGGTSLKKQLLEIERRFASHAHHVVGT